MLTETLTHIGLKPNEATIYLALMRIGTTHAGRLVVETKLPKATVYDTLESLEKRGLVHSYIHTKTTKYTAEDPEYIQHLLSKEARDIKQKQAQFTTILPELYGIRNEHFQVPKIRMYQGMEGMKIVLEDSLSAGDTIDTVVNVHDMETYFHDINEPYAQKRTKLNIKKRVLVPDTPWTREFLSTYIATKVSDIRFLPADFALFHVEMNIYDNKLTYITYRDREPVGVIIEDADIYLTQKAFFESLWQL